MRSKAKSSSTPYPLWIEGDYITNPPKRPRDGAERPVGHYIDKGGYPGANVYEINMDTFCMDTGHQDGIGKPIYEKDILIYDSEEELTYLIVEDVHQVVDIVHGEILEVQQLDTEDIKVIGNTIDSEDFIDGIRHYADTGLELPYLPSLNVQVSAYPYFVFKCQKCNHRTLACVFSARCKRCGGFLTIDYSSELKRGNQKALT